MSQLNTEQVQELADRLVGTPSTIESVLIDLGYDFTELDELSAQDLGDQIFQCSGCSWWCDVSEMSEEVPDDMVCIGCEREALLE